MVLFKKEVMGNIPVVTMVYRWAPILLGFTLIDGPRFTVMQR